MDGDGGRDPGSAPTGNPHWLNGRMVQEDNTSSMIHKVAELIEYISTFTRLSLAM